MLGTYYNRTYSIHLSGVCNWFSLSERGLFIKFKGDWFFRDVCSSCEEWFMLLLSIILYIYYYTLVSSLLLLSLIIAAFLGGFRKFHVQMLLHGSNTTVFRAMTSHLSHSSFPRPSPKQASQKFLAQSQSSLPSN